MKKSWLFLLLSVVLVLVLAACTQPNGNSSPPDQDQPAAEVDQEADADQADEMADEQEDSEADDDDSDMAEEEAEADSEEEAAPEIDAAALYAGSCAGCHGADRAGGGAPALLPGNLTQDASAYVNIITNGSGPMPSFGGRLSAEEIDARVEFSLSEPQ